MAEPLQIRPLTPERSNAPRRSVGWTRRRCGRWRARCVEGYPVDVGDGSSRASDIFTGVLSTFLEGGFQEVARRSPKRPIVRLDL